MALAANGDLNAMRLQTDRETAHYEAGRFIGEINMTAATDGDLNAMRLKTKRRQLTMKQSPYF